ncbi:MAG: type II secretion system protein [Planctomycetota bacterium]
MTTSRHARTARRGMTLVEMLVSIVLIVVLIGLLVVGGKTVRRSRMRAAAEQQMATITASIEQYAAFWPRWESFTPTGKILVSDKGWPDFSPGRLFTPGVFQVLAGFNDSLAFDVTDIFYSKQRDSYEDPDAMFSPGDVLNANSCLAYSLSSESGKGPFIADAEGMNLLDITRVHKQETDPVYPPYVGQTGGERRLVFVDPWGTPYRYFWVYRDSEPDLTLRAYRGYLPVETADIDHARFRKADTFVLESAGPDGEFGNVWAQQNDPLLDVDRAFDNLIVMP